MYNNIINLNNSFVPYLEKISDILTDTLSIRWFEYNRLYKDGNRFYISNNKKWFEYFIKNNFQDDVEYNQILWGGMKRKYTLWVGLQENKVLSGYFRNNMWNGLNYTFKKEENYLDLFSFSSTIEEKQVNNIYINSKDILNKAILVFNNEIHKELPLGDDSFLLKPRSYKGLLFDDAPLISTEMIDNFYEQTKIDRYYFNIGSEEFYLTRMEFMCLTLISHGESIKGVANKCSISPRTVESHINSIKLKTGKTSRSGIISILNHSPFDLSKDYIKRI